MLKRDELHQKLKQPYTPRKVSGVVKSEDPRFANVWFVVPPAPPRDRPDRMPLNALKAAHSVLADMQSITDAEPIDKMISYLFVRREAVQSSRMEGTWSTLDHVLTPGSLIEDGSRTENRASVLGYAKATESEIGKALRTGVDVFDVALVQRVHKSIMSQQRGAHGKAGLLRNRGDVHSVVWIGGPGRVEDSTFNPPLPEYIPGCLGSVMDWMSSEEIAELGDAGMGLSLPMRLAIGHAHFEAVHPFADGNGRVGRVLMSLQMACSGKVPIYLSGYIEREKKTYIGALAAAQKKLDYGPIVEFVCDAIVASHEEAKATRAALRALPDQWAKSAGFRGGSAASRALTELVMEPIFTASSLAEKLEVSTPAVMRAVKQLTEAGVVRERTGYVRNRVFAAEAVIEIMSRDFGSSVSAALKRARG